MDHEPGKEIPARSRVGFAQTARAVLWSFFGVRRKSDYEKDAKQLNPVFVIITGVAAAAQLDAANALLSIEFLTPTAAFDERALLDAGHVRAADLAFAARVIRASRSGGEA